MSNQRVNSAALALLLGLGSLGVRAQSSAPASSVQSAADAAVDPVSDETPPPRSPSPGSLSDELGTSQPNSSPSNPVGASYMNNLNGVINFGEHWSIDLGFLFTQALGAPPPAGSNFGSSGGHVSLVSLGADWDSGDHWSLGISSGISPKSSNLSSTSIQLNQTVWAARLNADSSNLELGLNAGYDTNGDSNAEWTFVASITGGHLDTVQKIDAVENPNTGKTRTAAELKAVCVANPKLCRKALLAALKSQDAELDSLKLALGATLTLFDSTDITVSGDDYLYVQDPSAVGYFNIAKGGRSVSGGEGVPIAPLRFDGRLELLHRFGPLSLKLWGSAGEYAVDAAGLTYSGGAKVQYKFTRAFRVWVTGSVQHDIDDTGEDFMTWTASLGAGYRF